jgi:acetyl-CoA carboxylase biotin carboxyl carrier protein
MSEGGAVDDRIRGGATETPVDSSETGRASAPAAVDSTETGGASAPAGSDAAARIEGLADDLLPALIARLESSALGELEVRTAGWRVRVCKPAGAADRAAGLAASVAGTSATAGGPTAAGHDHGVPLAHELSTSARGGAVAAAPHLPVPTRALAGSTGAGTGAAQHPGFADTATVHVAISPAVGFLVVRDGYGPGRAVHAGEVVGHVDCLGVPREVIVPEDGVIARNLAEQGEAVEYGQPLFDIEPGLPQPSSPAPEDR